MMIIINEIIDRINAIENEAYNLLKLLIKLEPLNEEESELKNKSIEKLYSVYLKAEPIKDDIIRIAADFNAHSTSVGLIYNEIRCLLQELQTLSKFNTISETKTN
jgi:hypothetical protein